jgi:hypothetical protein
VKLIKALSKIETGRDFVLSVTIKGAAAFPDIQQMAGGSSEENFAGVFVLKFIEATTSTAVAEGLPLRLGELFQPLV